MLNRASAVTPGARVLTEEEAPALRAECIRIARRVRASGHTVLGLIPATEHVAVPPVALQLGAALADLAGATVAVVDGNLRYPARPAAPAGETSYWVGESLALLWPARSTTSGQALGALDSLLREGLEAFAHALIDLTGFDLLGERAAASARMDGVIVVARAHRTAESDLLRARADVPDRRFSGVLLVG